MTGNFYTLSMRPCFLAVLFLTAISYGYAKNYGDECTKTSECDNDRLECVSMPTPPPTDAPTTEADPTTTEAATTTTEAEPTTSESGALSNKEPEEENADLLEEDDLEFVPRRHLLATEEVVENGKCQCKDNYELIDGKCRIVLSDDFYCENDDDCAVIDASPIYGDVDVEPKCKDGVCDCGNNWRPAMNESTPMCFKVPDVEDGSDYPVVECSVDQECLELYDNVRNTTASCNSTVCLCDEDDWKIYTYSNTSDPHIYFCARILDGACDEDIDCSHIDHASCNNNKCTCDDGYSADKEFKCSGAYAVTISIFLLLTSLWLTKESH